MNYRLNLKWLSLALATVLFACQHDDNTVSIEEEPVTATSGEADFSKYVAVGNSLTAGYADNALFLAGQENSFPNLMARFFELAGGGDFAQPLANDNVGGLLLGGNPIAGPRLIFDGQGVANDPGTPTTEVSDILPGPFNNMGVPGAKSFHLIAPGYGDINNLPNANPYFVRFASNPNTTVLQDALVQEPTFFSLWIGNNDVLAYATSGGTGENQAGNPNPFEYGNDDITDPDVFASVFSQIAAALTENDAKGLVANIPDVTSIAHFTTVPYNPVALSAAEAAALNDGYSDYNDDISLAETAGLISEEERIRRTIHFEEGLNPVVIEDEYLTDLSTSGAPSMRMATLEDLLVLPAMNFIGTLVDDDPELVNGVSVPLEDQWVLLPEEQEEIATATAAFNQTIEAVAAQHGLAFVDAHALMAEIAETGLPFDEFVMTAEFVFGGLFSLDGIHLTARGNALVANAMMQAINDTYGASLPMLHARDFPTFYPPSTGPPF